MKTTFTKALSLLALSGSINIYANQSAAKQNNISFTENKGQICDQNYNSRPDVLFGGSNKGLVYHLTQKGISYQLNRIDSWQETEDKKNSTKIKSPDQTTIYRVDINWVGANANTVISKGAELPGMSNYYLPQCPNGALNVKSFKDITYHNIYTGIDLKWYEKNGQLEYDFIVKPYADLKQIKIGIKGAEHLTINKNGELEIKTPLGTIIEKAPVAFQNNIAIKAKWVLENDVVSFKIENYNKDLPLTIDPLVRVFGTYYGGSGDEYLRSSTPDGSANIYSVGYTSSATGTIIATTGSHQTTYAGGTFDAFLVKFNSSGTRLFATYYGGAGLDFGLSCSRDVAGTSIYMAGYTTSSVGIATGSSHQSVLTATNDAFVVKFNSSGVRQWATYYGGTGNDYGYSVSVDPSGNVFMSGMTASPTTTLIATASSHQPAYGGSTNNDAFLVKFNSAGVRQWGTYYGAVPDEDGFSCATDGSGNIYMAGTALAWTNSLTIPTAGGHQNTFGGGTADAYLVKFDATGARIWGTWYGGPYTDQGRVCAVDASGNVLLSGISNTAAVGVVATSGAHQTVFAGGNTDGFVVKFNSAGVRSWGTYYGGGGDDYIFGLSTDPSLNIYLAGYTNSAAFISTTGTPQSAIGGGQDAFLIQFNAVGARQWGTYCGGAGTEFGYDVCVDVNNGIYLTGASASTTGTLVATPGTHQATYGGGAYDGFLDKYYSCQSLTVTAASSSPTICLGNTATLTATGSGFTTYTWMPGSYTTNSIVVNPSGTTTFTLIAGTSTAACNYSDTQLLTVVALPTVNILTSTTTVCSGATLLLTGNGASTYSWSTGATGVMTNVTPTTTSVYTVTGTAATSCSSTGTVSITVNPNPTVNISASSTTLCMGNSATLTASGASSYTWNTTATTTSIVVTPTVYTVYSATGTNGMCLATKTIAISMVSLPTVTLTTSSNTICTSATGGSTIGLSGSPSGGAYSGTSVSGQTFTAPPTAGTYTVVYSYTYAPSGCSNSTTKTITVNVCTGVEELSLNGKINVYPNPNNGEFTLIVPEQGIYTIINSIGQTVQSIEVKEDSQLINVQGLANGIYYVTGKSSKAKIVIHK